MSSFLGLPTEIRLQIYAKLAVEEVKVFWNQTAPGPWTCASKFNREGPSILLVNKQSYEEARPTIYRISEFTLVLDTDVKVARSDQEEMICDELWPQNKVQLALRSAFVHIYIQAVRLCVPLDWCLTSPLRRTWIRDQMKGVGTFLSKVATLRSLEMRWPDHEN